MQASNKTGGHRKVLAVPASEIEALYREPKFYCDKDTVNASLCAIRNHGRFVDRDWAEQNPSVKQIVAYAIIRNSHKILCLRRSKKGNRKSLRLRYTLMLGGHVDDLDYGSGCPLEDCVVREVAEEIGVIPSATPHVLGVVADPSNEVGLLHLGVIYDFPIELDHIVMHRNCDTAEFVNSGQVYRRPLLSPRSLREKAYRFDRWSELFIESEIAHLVFGESLSGPRQLRLPHI
ncbi:MAG: NUDIX domain-containing protein [Nitrososphaera sp.]